MAKFRGRIRHDDLEGGVVLLEGDDGTRYTLEGEATADKGAWPDGTAVEIDGRVDKQLLSFAMSGPVLVVKSAKKV